MLHVYELTVEGEHAPADVADQLNVSLGAVYAALAYYYDHPEEMRELRRRHAEAVALPRAGRALAADAGRVTDAVSDAVRILGGLDHGATASIPRKHHPRRR